MINVAGFKNKTDMKLKDVAQILNARIVCGHDRLEEEIEYAFSSDLMSDVLTQDNDKLLLLTGLANLQAIRTAEMSDIGNIVFVRNKHIDEAMIDLAKSNGMLILECPSSLFKASGLLYAAGVKPLY